jgi:hypothetical protein
MSHHDDAITDDDLDTIEERAAAATPGPWHLRFLDDSHAAGLVAVSTALGTDTGRLECWPDFAAGEMVAASW